MIIQRLIDDRMVEIEIVLGDITTQSAEVIVNAAHNSLMGGGGVDGAIHRAAGSSLLQECMELEEVEPGIRCRVGEACLTSGGNLLSQYIIHTVAPKFVGSIVNGVFKNSKEGTDEDLKACYVNSITLAHLNHMNSIAFPSLGCGGHAYPIEIAAPIAIKSTLEALKEATNISKVVFVCFSQSDYDEYVKSMKGI